MRNDSLKIVLVLTVVAIVAAGTLSYVHQATAPAIAKTAALALQQSILEVVPGAKSYSELTGEELAVSTGAEKPIDLGGKQLYEVYDAAGNPIGLVISTEGPGFNGPIQVMLGLNLEKREITGVKVLAQSETPGLGARITEDWFLRQFTGKSFDDPFAPKADIDSITGATISTGAVSSTIKQAINTIDSALSGGDIDPVLAVVPGAASYSEAEEIDGRQVYKVFDAAGNEIGIAFTAESRGFQSTIKVLVGVDPAKHEITGLRVLEQNETPGLGTRITEDWFQDQFIGMSFDSDFKANTDFDIVTGATISSAAVGTAVKDGLAALDLAAGSAPAAGTETAAKDPVLEVVPGAASYTEIEPVGGRQVYKTFDKSGKANGIVFTAEGQGFQSTIKVMVGVDPAKRQITGVKVLEQAETPGLGTRIEEPDFLAQFAGKSIDDAFKVNDDLDAITSATVSSAAVGDMIRAALDDLESLIQSDAAAASALPVLEVVPNAASYTELDSVGGRQVFRTFDAAGKANGIVFTTEGQGFQSTIKVIVGVDPAKRQITAVKVLEQAETPGLGTRIEEDEFLSQFSGKSIDDAFKANSDFDAITSATVSCSAVGDMIRNALDDLASLIETEAK